MRFYEIYEYIGVDEAVNSFNHKLTYILDELAPKKLTKTTSLHRAQWMTKEILTAIEVRDKLRKRAVATKEKTDWDVFRKYRNQLTSNMRSAKTKHIRSQLDPSVDSKRLWQNVKT